MKQLTQILLILWGGIISLQGYSQFNDTRDFTKRYKVVPEVQVEISNKYGNIEINSWDIDSVVFLVKIKVEEKSLAKLEKTMEGIDFDFTDNPHFIVARTIVNKTSSTLEKEFLKFKESLLQTEGNVEINYIVWLPKKCDLILENKYGNIIMNEFPGDCDLTLSNGNLKAYELTGKTEINLNFADATINKVNTALLNTIYSDVEIKAAKKLQIESKQSTFEILETTELKINSRRDKYRIRLADLVDASGSFSNFRIAELLDRITLRADYGDLDIEKINPEFSNILIESQSTDINLYFNHGSGFQFQITETKTEMDFCTEVEVKDKTVLDEKTKKTKMSGIFGTKTASPEKVFINVTLGKINIFSN
jgi:hypothetical protein